MNKKSLEAMSNLPLEKIDRDSLVDIRTVKTNPDEPAEQKMMKYLQQIKNPYCFLVGDIVVRVGFKAGGKTLDETFLNHLKSK